MNTVRTPAGMAEADRRRAAALGTDPVTRMAMEALGTARATRWARSTPSGTTVVSMAEQSSSSSRGLRVRSSEVEVSAVSSRSSRMSCRPIEAKALTASSSSGSLAKSRVSFETVSAVCVRRVSSN